MLVADAMEQPVVPLEIDRREPLHVPLRIVGARPQRWPLAHLQECLHCRESAWRNVVIAVGQLHSRCFAEIPQQAPRPRKYFRRRRDSRRTALFARSHTNGLTNASTSWKLA